MEKISDIFTVKTGGDLWLEKEIPGSIPVISLGFENNGVVGYIQKNEEHHLYPAGSITVSGWAGGMKAFVQVKDFYVRGRVKILIPKIKLTLQQKLYYCCCFNANAYRYTYGRKSSGERFSDLLIPSINELPKWINTYSINKLDTRNKNSSFKIDTLSWKAFKIRDVFECKTMKALDIKDFVPGNINYITRSALNNGNSGKCGNDEFINKGNCITIGAEGKYAFYQEKDFVAGVKVYSLRNKNLNKYNALFITTLLNKKVELYSYGRARILEKIREEEIKLPINDENKIDWNYMTSVIKKLPYGDKI